MVGRLRRVVERPEAGAQSVAVDLAQSVRSVLYLLEPECSRRSVQIVLSADATLKVMAEPVALDHVLAASQAGGVVSEPASSSR